MKKLDLYSLIMFNDLVLEVDDGHEERPEKKVILHPNYESDWTTHQFSEWWKRYEDGQW